MGPSSHISKDALINSSEYSAGGKVGGKLIRDTDSGRAGTSMNIEGIGKALSGLVMFLSVLFAIGMIILGAILIRMLPAPFASVVTTLEQNALMSFVYGIAATIISCILILFLLVTIIGIPIAIVTGLTFLICLIISVLFAGAVLGRFIAGKAGKELSPTLSFVVGFIILEILFLIPILGFLLNIIAICTGIGALVMATWNAMTSSGNTA
jgi:hypothetical protein